MLPLGIGEICSSGPTSDLKPRINIDVPDDDLVVNDGRNNLSSGGCVERNRTGVWKGVADDTPRFGINQRWFVMGHKQIASVGAERTPSCVDAQACSACHLQRRPAGLKCLCVTDDQRAVGIGGQERLAVRSEAQADRRRAAVADEWFNNCLLYTSPSPRDRQKSRMPSSA